MVRPREFDEDEVLERGMQIFWTQGYEGTSLRDLLAAMGISKSSFYETFGCKRDLFLRSLDHFHQVHAVPAVAKLDAGVPARTAVAEIFALLIDRAVNQKRGCMFGSSAVELAHCDPEIRERAAAGIGVVEDTFFKLLDRGKRAGELARACDARKLARSLTATFYGLQVMGNANVSQRILRDVISAALAELD